jgi:hypothetical protein
MAPNTGYVRSIGTNPGTTNCDQKRSIKVARQCMPTLRTIQGCISDESQLYLHRRFPCRLNRLPQNARSCG